jgi:replicative DNA helicase
MTTHPLLDADDAEAGVLGCALAYPSAAVATLGDLTPADLGSGKHSAILAAIRAVMAHTPPDPPLVLAALNEQTEVRHLCWANATHDVITLACTPGAALHYRRVILTATARRLAVDAARHLQHAATNPGDPTTLPETLDHAADALRAALSRLDRPGATMPAIIGRTRPRAA